MFEPKITDSDRLKVFGPGVDDILCKYQVKKVDKVDLIFIPVLLSDHYWCLCFNMKNGDIELIDNSRYAESFTKRYRGRPEKLSPSAIPKRQTWTKRVDNKVGKSKNNSKGNGVENSSKR
ncbi:hypothetical protein HanXRQr2_Chr12g0526631 [Helianthus annuus]|nr:hypothetical protein HanXRQr2_Chr12g0526631 [Helianthus annuus]KAJ0943170.1 hypothetical protein HanPSC8_Chr03g0100891 [Helianthus annuus]